MRRDPKAILRAHEMDPRRRELYVEGIDDRMFFYWIMRKTSRPKAQVIEIARVKIDDPPSGGGERGRLFHFAGFVEGNDVQIGFFADADFDHLLDIEVPQNIWLTDYRDMEAYLLRSECIEKVIQLGLGDESIDAGSVLENTLQIGRYLGCIRLVSKIDNLNLPFQSTRLYRYIDVQNGVALLQNRAFLQTLLQNARISLGNLSDIEKRVDEIDEEYASYESIHLIHGKDACVIIEEILRDKGLQRGDGLIVLRTSFDEDCIAEYPNLLTVCSYAKMDG